MDVILSGARSAESKNLRFLSFSRKNLLRDGLKRRNMGGMNRRQFAILLPAACALVSCDTDQKPSSTATLLNNSEVQNALKELDSTIDDLQSNVGRLDDENWRDVVPDIESATTDIRDAFDSLRQALGVSDS